MWINRCGRTRDPNDGLDVEDTLRLSCKFREKGDHGAYTPCRHKGLRLDGTMRGGTDEVFGLSTPAAISLCLQTNCRQVVPYGK